jgi:hypothetical protein
VVNARAAGYFCLYLIVENPDNSDSVLDIRSAALSFRTCRKYEPVFLIRVILVEIRMRIRIL